MAYARTDLEPWAWLKSVGTQEEPLRRDWRQTETNLLTEAIFTKHPRSMRQGDFLIYYAVGHGSLVAIGEVASDEVDPRHEDPKRFKWKMQVNPLVSLDLRGAPHLTQTPIQPTSVRRQSHIRVTNEAFNVARDLILKAVDLSIPRELGTNDNQGDRS